MWNRSGAFLVATGAGMHQPTKPLNAIQIADAAHTCTGAHETVRARRFVSRGLIHATMKQ
ncbi:hypothetical protein CUJ89_22115 [Burkholderia pyrrocinia]|uniref:Uncharacterized protein n=1 Tax=Burkholderia pyrrocinia TaxID=60550 RepID=A0A2Z5N2J3_BURPY|nr:hypothetical protein CUJ89_22115 [Burkholderia pyrrocinia]